MDFLKIRVKETRGLPEIYPDFKTDSGTKDLMLRGGAFYAIWDEELGIWSENENDVKRLVDAALYDYEKEMTAKTGLDYVVKDMTWAQNGSWSKWRKHVRDSPDVYHPLNSKLVFSGDKVDQTDYASKRLPYSLEKGDISAWAELVSVLYAPEQREKIEWAIGSVIAGESKEIQKFIVFYGAAGKGKSTILNIIEKLFAGYTESFDGRALGRSGNQFAASSFKDNPLVAIQHDGDLSRIEDNTLLNSIIAHETMRIEEKHKSAYSTRIEAMLFMGTNQPVKITDAKSGIIRRLIDVQPSGTTHEKKRYDVLMKQIGFELGAIAHHCLQVYKEMGPNHYGNYKPLEMMLQTDPFYNFIEAYYDLFKEQNIVPLQQAWTLYKEYCTESGIDRPLSKMKVTAELTNYFEFFHDVYHIDDKQVRNVYIGFTADKFKEVQTNGHTFSLVMEETESLFDQEFANAPAQLAKADGTPSKKWASVKTTLSDIDTTELHYVKVPENHIVIDFDLRGDDGVKALDRNLQAASEWPSTYAEISKSGEGVHLHYTYAGDPSELASTHSDGVEVKVYTGDGSLRRMRTRCNSVSISSLSSGLKVKEKTKVLSDKTVKSEKGLRDLIERNLKKEIHPGTKPSIDFIKHILDEAKESGMQYDVSDMRSRIVAFANNSSNQAAICLKTVQQIAWSSENPGEEFPADVSVNVSDERLAFFDVEVYSNLFVICWKFEGEADVVKMINPSPQEVEELFKLKLVGFYNRKFDNHILYAASMDSTPAKLFALVQKLIVDNNRNASFPAAYSLSYADVYDFSSEKMSLKQFEVKLGILHMELDIPWDQPVDEKLWDQVVEYCANDVRATEAVFDSRKGDFIARQILAEMSGLTVNDTTQRHAAAIIFGGDKHPQKKFKYTDLSEEFPGYKFELGKSIYKGEDPGEGGYVYAEPGVYAKVAVLDVASMHPASIEALNAFGPYTDRFVALRDARVAIKRKEYAEARRLLGDGMSELMDSVEANADTSEALSYALKIAINTVYGLTSAKFENPFRDNRNIDNIVAKRGALFMIDLKEALKEAGYEVVHIKTDSVKIPNALPDAIDFVMEFGKKYGYEFEHEATYDKFLLVNDAVYVAGINPVPFEEGYPSWHWTAVGAEFQHPYVFKKLFSHEPVEFDDYREARTVQKGAMYLDFSGSDEPDVSKMRHVGKTGQFVPVTKGGGVLYRVNEGKYYAVSRTKGFLWREAHVIKGTDAEDDIDHSYFEKLTDSAIATVEKFCSLSDLVN